MDTTPFEHVTVKDICQEAGVSRPTFYAYYRDKYDCAVYLVTRQTADVFGRLGPVSYTHLDVYKRQPSCECAELQLCFARTSVSPILLSDFTHFTE